MKKLFMILPLVLVLCFASGDMAFPATAQDLEHTETVIAGGPDKFAEVRYVILKGSNFEIGKKLGELAKKDGTIITPRPITS